MSLDAGGQAKWQGGFWRRKNLDYLITERCYVSVKEERANDK
ncbi:DNA-binding protein [Escherichia coli]